MNKSSILERIVREIEFYRLQNTTDNEINGIIKGLTIANNLIYYHRDNKKTHKLEIKNMIMTYSDDTMEKLK